MRQFAGVEDNTCRGLTEDATEDGNKAAVGTETGRMTVGEVNALACHTVELRHYTRLATQRLDETRAEALPDDNEDVGTVGVQQLQLRNALRRKERGKPLGAERGIKLLKLTAEIALDGQRVDEVVDGIDGRMIEELIAAVERVDGSVGPAA